MSRLKRLAAILLTGFLMFAPPGTLIVCAALVTALFGRIGLISAIILCLLGLALWLRRRRRAARGAVQRGNAP